MQTPTPASSDPDRMEEARFRARMARVSLGSAPRARRPRQDDDDDEQDGGFRLGWMGWLAIDTLVVLGTIAAVVVWPPIESCRAQDRAVGFYAGDSVEKCVRRGVSERLSNADQRVKMMLRGSGR